MTLSLTPPIHADVIGHDGLSPAAAGVSAARWTTTDDLGQRRLLHTATLLQSGEVLVVGGHNGRRVRASAELYDPSTGTWAATGRMSISRFGHTATLLKSGKVLVVGGVDSRFHVRADAEIYDPATGTWTKVSDQMAARRFGHTATRLESGRVLVVGGEDGRGRFHQRQRSADL